MSVDDPYTTRQSVIERLPPGGIPTPAALVASSLAGSDVITLDGHGYETDTPVSVRAVENGTLSAPLVEGTTYYAIRLTNAEFKLAATPGGSAIDLTTDAVSMFVMREPNFDYWIGRYSRWVDNAGFDANLVPFGRTEPVHPLVEMLVADLVAKRMFNIGGQASDTIDDMEVKALAQLQRFAAGLPLRGATATASANLAVTSTLGATSDPRGWGSGTLP